MFHWPDRDGVYLSCRSPEDRTESVYQLATDYAIRVYCQGCMIRFEMILRKGNRCKHVGKLTLDSAIGSMYSHNELVYPRLELPARRWTLYWLAQVLPIRRIL